MIGVLLHVYHLETLGWEQLIWGNPATDELGSGTKFIECLLDIPLDTEVRAVIYSGPSQKDGLTEGAYTKKFLLDRIDQLQAFPRLRTKINNLPPGGLELLRGRLEAITLGPLLKNTADEVANAALLFRDADIVFQVAAASHAPRCLLTQVAARRSGDIPKDQSWYIVPSDICFAGTTPNDVLVLEPPHRGDDPMLGYSPTLPQALRPTLGLATTQKQELIAQITANTNS